MAKGFAHRQGIDLARFIAAFGVCVAHAFSAENDWDGHVSLALFTILTAFLSMQSMQRSGQYAVMQRVRRLLLPWLVWSAFYKLVWWKVSDGQMGLLALSDPWSLLVGASEHLWFLPFVALAMFLVQPLGRLVTNPVRLATGLVVLLAVALPMYLGHQRPGLPVPFPQWLFAFPVYALGLMMALAHGMARPWWPVVAAAALSAEALWATGGLALAYTVLAAALAFEAFWRLPVQHPILPRLGQAAFGIYLLHPFFMLVTFKFLGPEVNRMLAAVLTFLMAWGATVALRRLPLFVKLT